MRVRVWISVEYDTYKRFYKFELATWLLWVWRWGRRIVRMVIANPRDWGLTCTVCGCDQRGVLCRSCVGKTCRGGCQGVGFTVTELMARRQRRGQLAQGMYQRKLADQTKVVSPPPLARKSTLWETCKDILSILFCDTYGADDAMRQARQASRPPTVVRSLPVLVKKPSVKAQEYNL